MYFNKKFVIGFFFSCYGNHKSTLMLNLSVRNSLPSKKSIYEVISFSILNYPQELLAHNTIQMRIETSQD